MRAEDETSGKKNRRILIKSRGENRITGKVYERRTNRNTRRKRREGEISEKCE